MRVAMMIALVSCVDATAPTQTIREGSAVGARRTAPRDNNSTPPDSIQWNPCHVELYVDANGNVYDLLICNP